MSERVLWEFPVPSTNLCGDVTLVFPGSSAWLFYEYFADDESDTIYNSGIRFKHVQVHRHANEKFVPSLLGAYDKIVEIDDSDWIRQLVAVNPQIAAFWNIRHYAIYLDSNGLYEFAATGFDILDTVKGRMKWNFSSEIEKFDSEFDSRNGIE